MATKREFIEFLLNQLDQVDEIKAKPMFGEYGVFSGSKIFGLVCDDKLFIKPTGAGRDFIGEVVEAPPYPGAKNSFLIEDKLEDAGWLNELVKITVAALPEPRRRKKKKNGE